MPVTISRTVKKRPPSIPVDKLVDKIAGKSYQLSLVFVGEKRAQALNIEYRNKNYIPNVLSFPLDKSTGEIFICPSVARREAKKFNLSYKGYLTFLLIHGLLHLKGHQHGDTMEGLERKYMRAFAVV